ncbi:MAG: methyltransferase domain-containing protein [Alphaproteobacteria bacterium]|nr:methyltransferase domain-containing protein [Alphaproteobacteria bacterium]
MGGWRGAARLTLAAALAAGLAGLAAVPPQAATGRLLEKRESLYNNIFVFRDRDTISMTFGHNKRYFTESLINLKDPGALSIEYARYMTLGLAYAANTGRILEIGLGGGSIVTYLNRALPESTIVAVEIDKDVVDLARKYFQFQESDRLKAVVADGRAYLLRDDSKWDIVLLDAYRGPFVPFHLLTREFYTLVKSRLAPGGVVVQNIEPSTMLFDSAIATMSSVFRSVDFYDGRENVVAVAHDGPAFRQADLMTRAASVQTRYKLRYDLRRLVAERRVLRKPRGKVMTDDFAPVETLRAIEQHNQKWKEQTEAPR